MFGAVSFFVSECVPLFQPVMLCVLLSNISCVGDTCVGCALGLICGMLLLFA